MSIRYALAVVSTLNETVPPWSTLMLVAKPWIDVEPAPLTSHSLGGLPGLVFSQATGFVIGASHGAATAGDAGMTSSPAVTATIATGEPPTGPRRSHVATLRPSGPPSRPPFGQFARPTNFSPRLSDTG